MTPLNEIKPVDKSRQGFGFLTGFLGAYIIPVLFVRFGLTIGLQETFSLTNAGYIMNVLGGLTTGILTVYISRNNQKRILFFVVGTLLVMDNVAFFTTDLMTVGRMINRGLIDFSTLIGGYITYLVMKRSSDTE